MADPLSLIVAGAGLGVIGNIAGGYSQAANYQAQANAQNYNAAVQKQQSRQVMSQATEQANAQHRRAAQALGEQRAATAQAGIGFEGTGGDLIDQSANYAELDRQNILYQGLLNSEGLDAQSEQSTYAAQVATSQQTPSIIGGFLSGSGTLLSGVGNYMGASRGIDRQRQLNTIRGT